jgi:hypothetical protein
MLALPGVASASGQAQDFSCATDSTHLYYSGTYDNVVVPPNSACLLSDSTILGNVTVQTNSTVEFENNGVVHGHVAAGDNTDVTEDDPGWTIDGPILGKNTQDISIAGNTHSILADNLGYLTIQSGNVDGSIALNQGQVSGFITTSQITGNLVMNGTTGEPPGPFGPVGFYIDGAPGVAPQDIGGDVVLTNNTQEIYLDGNHIHRNLVCAGNNPPPFNSVDGVGNQVDGRSVGQCATLNPAPSS